MSQFYFRTDLRDTKYQYSMNNIKLVFRISEDGSEITLVLEDAQCFSSKSS